MCTSAPPRQPADPSKTPQEPVSATASTNRKRGTALECAENAVTKAVEKLVKAQTAREESRQNSSKTGNRGSYCGDHARVLVLSGATSVSAQPHGQISERDVGPGGFDLNPRKRGFTDSSGASALATYLSVSCEHLQ